MLKVTVTQATTLSVWSSPEQLAVGRHLFLQLHGSHGNFMGRCGKHLRQKCCGRHLTGRGDSQFFRSALLLIFAYDFRLGISGGKSEPSRGWVRSSVPALNLSEIDVARIAMLRGFVCLQEIAA